MRAFLRFSILYLMMSLAIGMLLYPSFTSLMGTAISVSVDNVGLMRSMMGWFGLVLVILFLTVSRDNLRSRASAAICAIVGCLALQVGFTLIKSMIPSLVPFYADPYLANLDYALLGGQDAWKVAHEAISHRTMNWILPIYLGGWTVPAMTLPIIIALTDSDLHRIRRFKVMYLFCWIILGNVLAIAFSSVGPVFYDALLGGQRFAGLDEALRASGLTDSIVGRVQSYMWRAYDAHNLSIGAGISAFPSVHLAIATVTALYMGERSRWLIVPGVAFVGIILVLSVYTGYHYAIDGYFSIVVILLLWIALRRIHPPHDKSIQLTAKSLPQSRT